MKDLFKLKKLKTLATSASFKKRISDVKKVSIHLCLTMYICMYLESIYVHLVNGCLS